MKYYRLHWADLADGTKSSMIHRITMEVLRRRGRMHTPAEYDACEAAVREHLDRLSTECMAEINLHEFAKEEGILTEE